MDDFMKEVFKAMKEEADSIPTEQKERMDRGCCPYCGFDFQKLLDNGTTGFFDCPDCGRSKADLTNYGGYKDIRIAYGFLPR